MLNDPGQISAPGSRPDPAIVFLHGSGDSGCAWSDVVAQLPQYTCIALDLPGHGTQLDSPGPAVMSVPEYASAIHAVLVGGASGEVNVGGRGICLVGHSLGSAIAMRLAVDYPVLVSHLVLVGAGARLRVLPALLEEARTHPGDAMRKLVTLGLAPDHEASAQQYLDALRPTAPSKLHRDLSACDQFDMTAELGRIHQPTLVIVGEADRLTPPKYAAFLANNIAGAEQITIPDAGHYIPTEAPAALAAALHHWLSRQR